MSKFAGTSGIEHGQNVERALHRWHDNQIRKSRYVVSPEDISIDVIKIPLKPEVKVTKDSAGEIKVSNSKDTVWDDVPTLAPWTLLRCISKYGHFRECFIHRGYEPGILVEYWQNYLKGGSHALRHPLYGQPAEVLAKSLPIHVHMDGVTTFNSSGGEVE